jgi:WD repeat-containing protein 89
MTIQALDLRTDIKSYRDQRIGQMRWQSSENNEDITALQHHPSNDRLLLSGGDDGLVSIFDTSIQDENDSLVQAFDHGVLPNQHPSGPVYVSPRLPTLLPQAKKVVLGPIHKAGFLSDNAIYALSADQKFSIHPFLSSEPDDSDAVQPALFGDLRPTAQCDYVIDVLRDPNQPYVVTGSHNRYEDWAARCSC